MPVRPARRRRSAIAGFRRDEEHHSVFLDRHSEDGIRVGDRWEEVLYDRLHSVDAWSAW